MLNDGLFKFLLKAQQGMLDLNLRIDDESMPKQSVSKCLNLETQ